MNITLTPERLASLEAEAARRNAVPNAIPTTAEEIATQLVSAAADSYAATARDTYVRGLYERIKTADAATQSDIFNYTETQLA
jgi:hypothetical protein